MLLVGRQDYATPTSFGGATSIATVDCIAVATLSPVDGPTVVSVAPSADQWMLANNAAEPTRWCSGSGLVVVMGEHLLTTIAGASARSPAGSRKIVCDRRRQFLRDV